MGLLEKIDQPSDLRNLTSAQLRQLAAEIREFLIPAVAATGGHMGPNLGVVELTIAIHRVFNSPTDVIVFDTGHQAYVHKLLTGRKDFSKLRQAGGLSGYPARAESLHDVVENSHASASLSWASGIAQALLTSRPGAHVVAVIGDGALTGGMAWEALNNIAENTDTKLTIIVNDNGRSYAPTIGGLAHHLDALRTSELYERALTWGKQLRNKGLPGELTYDALHGLKRGVKDVIAPQVLFEDLGIKYLGPVDGHDISACEFLLTRAKNFGHPTIVHALTEKGRGYSPAEQDIADRFHAVGKIHPETGLPIKPSRFGWTAVFAQEMLELAKQHADLVGITAAMLQPVGLAPMQEAYPERVYDVGIAEQHAMTMAAGLSYGGKRPVLALYATFMNRAFDQLLLDVALHKENVTIALDRAGVTGDDGASHNGVWDIAIAAMIPGLQLAAPRDEQHLRMAIREAVTQPGPSIVRYPKGPVIESVPALHKRNSYDIIRSGQRCAVVALGPMVQAVCAALDEYDIDDVEVIDPVWALPVHPELVAYLLSFPAIVTIEDGLREGGFGSRLQVALANASLENGVSPRPLRSLGVDSRFLAHASRAQILHECGMDAAAIAAAIDEVVSAAENAKK